MIDILYVPAAAVAGAILYRIRGGWLPTGSTQLARVIWCIPTGALVGALTGDVLVGGLTALAAFLALMTPHGRWFDIANMDGRLGDDLTAMAALGLLRMWILLAPAAVLMDEPWLFAAAGLGLLHAPVYWLGWKLPVPTRWRGNSWRPIEDSIAWCELLWGAVQWPVLVILLQ